MGQDCFRLVICGMRDGNVGQATRCGSRVKKLVPQASRSVLDVPAVAARLAGDIGARRHKTELELSRQRGDKLFIFIRLSATQLVVEMEDLKANSESLPKFGEQAQKGN
jgi:hypothetical protein